MCETGFDKSRLRKRSSRSGEGLTIAKPAVKSVNLGSRMKHLSIFELTFYPPLPTPLLPASTLSTDESKVSGGESKVSR
jgi:hypothetical protein